MNVIFNSESDISTSKLSENTPTPLSSKLDSAASSIFEAESIELGAKVSLRSRVQNKLNKYSKLLHNESHDSIDEVLNSPPRSPKEKLGDNLKNLHKKGSKKITNLFHKKSNPKPQPALPPKALHTSAGQLLVLLNTLNISPQTSAADLEVLLSSMAEEPKLKTLPKTTPDASFKTTIPEIRKPLTPMAQKKKTLQKLFDEGTKTRTSNISEYIEELCDCAEVTLYDRVLSLKNNMIYHKPTNTEKIGKLDLNAPAFYELSLFFASLTVNISEGWRPADNSSEEEYTE